MWSGAQLPDNDTYCGDINVGSKGCAASWHLSRGKQTQTVLLPREQSGVGDDCPVVSHTPTHPVLPAPRVGPGKRATTGKIKLAWFQFLRMRAVRLAGHRASTLSPFTEQHWPLHNYPASIKTHPFAALPAKPCWLIIAALPLEKLVYNAKVSIYSL